MINFKFYFTTSILVFILILSGCVSSENNQPSETSYNEPQCNDSTPYMQCSLNKPYYCANGTLIKNVTLCGCPQEEIIQNGECKSKFEVTAENKSFNYIIRKNKDSINFTVYSELDAYLAALPRTYICDPTCPTDEEIELKIINEPHQLKHLKDLAQRIKNKTNVTDDQARIAVSLVQNIPYDGSTSFLTVIRTEPLTNRYPYEVLYDNAGVCGEKSRLLAFLLRELGYGVVLFDYTQENHMTVGIKCPVNYSLNNTGYCFIETNEPTIITNNDEKYEGGKLNSTPIILKVSDGSSFESVSEEYNDARIWIRGHEIQDGGGNFGEILPTIYTLENKYGADFFNYIYIWV